MGKIIPLLGHLPYLTKKNIFDTKMRFFLRKCKKSSLTNKIIDVYEDWNVVL